jgi:50S ribosomal protein L16 3-hydroxylase
MDVNAPLDLLGGLSPAVFMKRHWQKKPLLVRRAVAGGAAPVSRSQLFALAGQAGVESRLVQKTATGWRVKPGPLGRRALPPLARAGWTLLVQGLDLHVPAAHALLQRFRFVPDARLDDLMVSWASPGGGVGPHVDSYDVFLMQVEGRRRWRVGFVGRGRRSECLAGAPLKLLQHFEPTQEWLLEPGDMLYLPPQWGHDGVAEGGDCMTCSIGFRAPAAAELAREMLLRLADEAGPAGDLYRDPGQAATPTPGAVPAALQAFAEGALQRQLADPLALARVLGEWLTEPKSQVWFDKRASTAASESDGPTDLALDPRTRMMYDDTHVFINGEAFRAAGRDARVMRDLADTRRLTAKVRAGLSAGAAELLDDWCQAGWIREELS